MAMTIVFAGRSTFDLGYVCPSFPEENGKLSATHFWAGAGGCALNAAVTARMLGSKVRLLTLLGTGPFADAVRGELAQYDVPCEDFAPHGEVLPVSSIFVVPGNGSRTIVDQQPPQALELPFDPVAALDGANMVLTDGFLPDLAVPLCREARARSVPVVLDGGSWKPWSGDILPLVDIAIVSERFRPDTLAEIHALGPSHAALTRGEHPIEWSAGGRSGRVMPPRVEAVDTLGAGDVFHGAFCHFLAAGANFPQALEQAAGVAAQSCRGYGPRLPRAASRRRS